MYPIVKSLLNEPELPLVLDELKKAFEEEQQRRKFFQENAERYDAEFINGEIISKMANTREHLRTRKFLSKLLDTFVQKNNLGEVLDEHALISLTRNDYEPDVCFWKQEKANIFDNNQLRFPAPDFVAEIISHTTEKRDRGVKFKDYALHQIAEYWIIDTHWQTVEQYGIENAAYQLLNKIHQGSIRSRVIENFEIPVQALFDEKQNMITLTQLLLS